ncbi:MAG TPA: FliH/SctL family protein [Dongiaceae bacterium]|nr:FliH/SctL family protein [Dongiaceae bacterium]
MSFSSTPESFAAEGEIFRYVSATADSEALPVDGGAPWSAEVNATALAEKREKEAHQRGLHEGENRARVACEAGIAALRLHIQAAVEAFQNEREDYFHRIEPEVVQLALAIARKILHREAQIDPLLLTALVHVALEKLDAGARVRLRVHPADTHSWNEFFAQTNGTQSLELLGDATLPHGECLLETEVGSTQISLDTQLKEIEQGFFDLLEQRPRVR